MKKLMVVLVLVAVGLVVGTVFYSRKGHATEQPPRREVVDLGPIVEKISGTGRVVPRDPVIVPAEVPLGRVVEVLADVGLPVKKDQLLLRLDDEMAQIKLREARANKASAEALIIQAEAAKRKATAILQAANENLKFATEEHDARKKLAAANLSSTHKVSYEIAVKALDAAKSAVSAAEAGIDEANAAMKTAQAKVDAAELGVHVAELGVKAMTIRSPIEGVILEKKVGQGQLVSAQGTPVLFVIVPDLNQVQVQAQIGEAGIGKVKEGMEATFTLDAYADENVTFKGRVSQIAMTPTSAAVRLGQQGDVPAATIAMPVLYTVTIDVIPPKGWVRPLRPGLAANVDLVIHKVRDNVLRVPTQALSYRPEPLDPQEQKLIEERDAQGWKPLWVWKEGAKPQLVFVKPGATDGSRTQVVQVEGVLQEGTEVIVEAPPPPEKTGLFEAPTPVRI